MSYRVVFCPQAQAELLEARDWYEARQDGLGAEFSAAIEATVSISVSGHWHIRVSITK